MPTSTGLKAQTEYTIWFYGKKYTKKKLVRKLKKSYNCNILRADVDWAKIDKTIRFYGKKYMENDCKQILLAGSAEKLYTGHGHEKRPPQTACLSASAIYILQSETFFIFVA